jgi:hypothetical protein
VTNGFFCTRQLCRFLVAIPLGWSVWNFQRCFTYIRPLASKMWILCFLCWAPFFKKSLTVLTMYRKKQKVVLFCWFILENHFESIPNAQNSERKNF